MRNSKRKEHFSVSPERKPWGGDRISNYRFSNLGKRKREKRIQREDKEKNNARGGSSQSWNFDKGEANLIGCCFLVQVPWIMYITNLKSMGSVTIIRCYYQNDISPQCHPYDVYTVFIFNYLWTRLLSNSSLPHPTGMY